MVVQTRQSNIYLEAVCRIINHRFIIGMCSCIDSEDDRSDSTQMLWAMMEAITSDVHQSCKIKTFSSFENFFVVSFEHEILLQYY